MSRQSAKGDRPDSTDRAARRALLAVAFLAATMGCGDDETSVTEAGEPGATGATTTSGTATGGSGTAAGSGGATGSGEAASTSTGAGGPGAGGSATSSTSSGSGGGSGGGALALPPPDGGLDYQLGGAYAPPEGVEIVARDRLDAPAPGAYSICYVNGFQIQPGEEGFWEREAPLAMLRDQEGQLVIDPDWDEVLLDTSTPENRAAIAEIVGGWIASCASDGFDAVEIDNLDTFTRSQGLLSEEDAVLQMALFSAAAHDAGLAIAQKNSAEIAWRQPELGTDFAVVEECFRWSECDLYTDVYADRVLVIEYRREDFEQGCSERPELSIVLRDLDLVTPDDPAYVFDGC